MQKRSLKCVSNQSTTEWIATAGSPSAASVASSRNSLVKSVSAAVHVVRSKAWTSAASVRICETYEVSSYAKAVCIAETPRKDRCIPADKRIMEGQQSGCNRPQHTHPDLLLYNPASMAHMTIWHGDHT